MRWEITKLVLWLLWQTYLMALLILLVVAVWEKEVDLATYFGVVYLICRDTFEDKE